MITRWSPSLEERAAIVRGEDIYVEIISGGIVHPIRVMIGPRDFNIL